MAYRFCRFWALPNPAGVPPRTLNPEKSVRARTVRPLCKTTKNCVRSATLNRVRPLSTPCPLPEGRGKPLILGFTQPLRLSKGGNGRRSFPPLNLQGGWAGLIFKITLTGVCGNLMHGGPTGHTGFGSGAKPRRGGAEPRIRVPPCPREGGQGQTVSKP